MSPKRGAPGADVPQQAYDGATIRGLSDAAAAARLKSEGYNELPRADRRSIFRIFYEVVRQPMFALLLGGGVVYLLLGDLAEALILLVFASLSVTITIVQEARSERVLEALRDLASPRALVIRDERRIRIPGREVVRDDIVVLAEGDRVPADSILLSAHDLLLDESLLTGESVPVRKTAVKKFDPGKGQALTSVPGGEDLPHVFAGSLVVRGSGLGLVQAIGLHTEMGKIGRALGTIALEQPRLQRQIRWVVRDFAIIGAIAGTLVVLLFGLLRGSWLGAALAGIALGMSLLPEEFPLVLTVFMAMGAWRISRAHVLTRRAAAIETLGAATVLCTDKTGTLTENRMTVVALETEAEVWAQGQEAPLSKPLRELAHAAFLASAPESADPMERALHDFLADGARPPAHLHDGKTLARAYGLRPDLFAMTNVWLGADGLEGMAYVKGAPEAIARLCHLEPKHAAHVQKSAHALADRGIRVLGVATAAARGPAFPESQHGFKFHFLGLIGFADPVRGNVPEAVRECRSAGIRVIMITGDYPNTARAIAAQAGLSAASAVTGDDIEAMKDAELARHVATTSVFARIRPTQKLRIIEALKANGEVVAMTGDGVNDAPAMKAAHIGIAMGKRGTDVAREASSMVLLNDDFGSIVTTIRLGRRIYDNLRKAMEYIVAVHIPIAGLALLPLFLGLPLMLTPIHIAFLEMVIDPACSIVFEAEEEEDDVMRRAPRDPESPLLPKRVVLWAVIQGAFACILISAVLIIGAHRRMPEGDLRALVFTTLVLMNMGLILINRSFGTSFLAALVKPNRSLWVLLSGVTVLLGLALFSSPGAALFHFGPLHWDDLSVCIMVGIGMLVILETIKPYWQRSHL